MVNCDRTRARRIPGSKRSSTVSESPSQPLWIELTVTRMPKSSVNRPRPSTPSWRSATNWSSRLDPATIACDAMAASGRPAASSRGHVRNRQFEPGRWSNTTPIIGVLRTSRRCRTVSRSWVSVPRSTTSTTPSAVARRAPSRRRRSAVAEWRRRTRSYRLRNDARISRPCCDRNRLDGSSIGRPPVIRSSVAAPPTPIVRRTSSNPDEAREQLGQAAVGLFLSEQPTEAAAGGIAVDDENPPSLACRRRRHPGDRLVGVRTRSWPYRRGGRHPRGGPRRGWWQATGTQRRERSRRRRVRVGSQRSLRGAGRAPPPWRRSPS